MYWQKKQIVKKLLEIKAKGYISIPEGTYRRDEGVIGQILEREFGVQENNLSVRDLGSFELKGMRSKSKTLTLGHKTTNLGLTPIEVFDRFGYIKPSSRDKSILKKKLFTTVKSKPNNHNLRLLSSSNSRISMYYSSEFICSWDLSDSLQKINAILLVVAETKGKTGSKKEKFHFIDAYLLKDLKPLSELVPADIVVIDFCIDQPVDSNKGPHDRGPHIRVPKSKLFGAYLYVEKIM